MTDNMKFTLINFCLVDKQHFILFGSDPFFFERLKINGSNTYDCDLCPWNSLKQYRGWYNAYFRESNR